LKKWSFREEGKFWRKKFLWLLIGISAVIFAYTYGLIPLLDAKKKADEEIILKQRILAKYAEIMQGRKAAEESFERTLKQTGDIQKRLLPGETPQLGAANLQDIVKRLAEKNFLSLRSFRNLEPKETGVYRKISLQIEFNPINSMMNLSQFIHDLENQEKEFMISEMDLLIFNPRMPNTIQGSMVVAGFMKGDKIREKDKEK